jgi:uncharacterized protein (DUF1330 family)
MPFEILVGLQVLNDDIYDQYRAAMNPILERFGGGFRYDFRVAEVLQSESSHSINRVFTIHFVDETCKNAFFSDAPYLEIRQRFFERSVRATSIISEYRR